MWANLKRDPFLVAWALASALLIVPYLVPLFSEGAMEAYAEQYSDIPLIAIAIGACLAGRRRASSLERRFWIFIGVALACWLVVRVVTIAVPGDVYMTTWFGLLIDGLYVTFYLFCVLALDLRPDVYARLDVHGRLRALRFAATVVFVFGLLVYFAMIPGAVNPDAYETWVPSLLLYVSLDIYLLARVAYLTRATPDRHWRAVYSWLLIAVAFWLVTDSYEALSYGLVVPSVAAGTLLDLAWFPPFLTLVVAARLDRLAPEVWQHSKERASVRPSRIDRVHQFGGLLALFTIAFPVIHFSLYPFDVLDAMSRPAREVVVLLFILVLAAMTIMYQRRLAAETGRLQQEHEQLTEQLRHSQRLQALGQLTGGIAHDFNNLLAVIQANVGLLRDHLSTNAVEPQELEEVAASARRGAVMIEKLLGFGRQQLLTIRPVELAEVVRELEATLRRLLPGSIELHTTVAHGLPLVRADPGSIEQMLVNCATNARDAMPRGGRLSIEVGATQLDEGFITRHGWGEPGSYVRVRIRDTGVGMDIAVRERVFEPFFTTKQPGAGTGLGLSMVYGLIKQHGGFVDITSEPDRGTTVDLYFVPAGHDQAPVATVAKPTPMRGGTEAILLVEDEEPLRRAARRVLERAGYSVLVANDGSEALVMLDNVEVDLVISDVVMPKMGGPALLASARAQGCTVPFLLTSGYTNPAAIDAAAPLLYKPWETEELLARVREILDGAAQSNGATRTP